MSNTITPRQNTFKFVYFDGQNEALEGNNPNGKKRKKPRPITSCQTCRRRKIKCLNNLLPCEACIESNDHCSLLDPPPDSSFPPDHSSSSTSFAAKPQGSSTIDASSHEQPPPPPPTVPSSSSSSSFPSAPAPNHQPTYSPTTQDSQQLKRPSSSSSTTTSKSRSPPPSHDHHENGSSSHHSSSSNKRARHSLPNPTTTLPSFQSYEPPAAHPVYNYSSSGTAGRTPLASSSRPTQTQPPPPPPPAPAPPHQNSIAFLLHPWSPANDEFGPGRVRGAKVEPLPVGVPVGLGAEAVGKKDASGVLFKVPAIPLGRGNGHQQQQPVAPSSSSSFLSGSNPSKTSPPTLPPLASSSSHHLASSTAQPTPPTISNSISPTFNPTNSTSSQTPIPTSTPFSPFDASFDDQPSSSDLADLKRTFLSSLSFLFPWIGSPSAKQEVEEEMSAGAVDLAVASWGTRISSGSSSQSKGKETARRYLERARAMSVVGGGESGEMGVQELESVLMVAWSEYGLSGSKTSWLFCSFAARMVETILLESQSNQGVSSIGNGTSPSSSTSNSSSNNTSGTSNSTSATTRSSSSLSPSTNQTHPSPALPLPPHLHLSLFQLSTLLSLSLPIHSHLHVPPPPPPSLPLPPHHNHNQAPNSSSSLSPSLSQPSPPVPILSSMASPLTTSLHQAWSSLLDLLHQIALLLRGGGGSGGRKRLEELMQLGFELYGHLGERGGVLDPLGSSSAGGKNGNEKGAGAEGRLALEVWMLGVFVFLNTPSLLPQHLQPSSSSTSARNARGTTNGYSPSSRSTAVPSSSDPSSSSSSSVALSSATKLTTHLQLGSSHSSSLAQTLPFLDTPVRWAQHVLEREISERGGGGGAGGGNGPAGMVGMILIGEMKECVGVCREFLGER